ncbi:MAG TPA: hypothetical protein VFU10_12915 [Gaiellaceae bacterium]|nr:hypothetical protein [Gaiellaceae bacterium]
MSSPPAARRGHITAAVSHALGDQVARITRGRELDRVYARGHVDPVIVEDDDVILPEWALPIAARIRMVVLAALR